MKDKPPEREMYGDVSKWLEGRLRVLYPKWQISVWDTSRVRLSSFLERKGLSRAFIGSEAFEIEVDVTGVLRHGKRTQLAFVECKAGPITLKDIGQIHGYSKVASPALALILSPGGVSTSLHLLLHTYNRVDLLDYGPGMRLKVCKWDAQRKQVDPASVFPPGELG